MKSYIITLFSVIALVFLVSQTTRINNNQIKDGINRVTMNATQSNSTLTAVNVNTLTFNVESGNHYTYKVWLNYTTAATTTGIRLGVTAPSNEWHNTSTVLTLATTNSNLRINNNTMIINTGTPALTNNVAFIEGEILATTNGSFKIQFASEVNGSAITLQPGSTLSYQILN